MGLSLVEAIPSVFNYQLLINLDFCSNTDAYWTFLLSSTMYVIIMVNNVNFYHNRQCVLETLLTLSTRWFLNTCGYFILSRRHYRKVCQQYSTVILGLEVQKCYKINSVWCFITMHIRLKHNVILTILGYCTTHII